MLMPRNPETNTIDGPAESAAGLLLKKLTCSYSPSRLVVVTASHMAVTLQQVGNKGLLT